MLRAPVNHAQRLPLARKRYPLASLHTAQCIESSTVIGCVPVTFGPPHSVALGSRPLPVPPRWSSSHSYSSSSNYVRMGPRYPSLLSYQISPRGASPASPAVCVLQQHGFVHGQNGVTWYGCYLFFNGATCHCIMPSWPLCI